MWIIIGFHSPISIFSYEECVSCQLPLLLPSGYVRFFDTTLKLDNYIKVLENKTIHTRRWSPFSGGKRLGRWFFPSLVDIEDSALLHVLIHNWEAGPEGLGRREETFLHRLFGWSWLEILVGVEGPFSFLREYKYVCCIVVFWVLLVHPSNVTGSIPFFFLCCKYLSGTRRWPCMWTPVALAKFT